MGSCVTTPLESTKDAEQRGQPLAQATTFTIAAFSGERFTVDMPADEGSAVSTIRDLKLGLIEHCNGEVTVPGIKLFKGGEEEQLPNHLPLSSEGLIGDIFVVFVDAEDELAREDMIEQWGFPPEHLELLHEFYTTPRQPPVKLITGQTEPFVKPSWKSEHRKWSAKASKLSTELRGKKLVAWTKLWEADCTDASEQRYLKARPNEEIKCKIVYNHRDKSSTCIIQYQIGVDCPKVSGVGLGNISQVSACDL